MEDKIYDVGLINVEQDVSSRAEIQSIDEIKLLCDDIGLDLRNYHSGLANAIYETIVRVDALAAYHKRDYMQQPILDNTVIVELFR